MLMARRASNLRIRTSKTDFIDNDSENGVLIERGKGEKAIMKTLDYDPKVNC